MIYSAGPKCWRVQVELGKDAITGKRKRLTATVHGSKKQAQEKELELKMRAGDTTVVTSLTFGSYVENTFLPTKHKLVQLTREGKVSGKKRFKQTTYDSYEQRLSSHVMPYMKDMTFSEITPQDVRRVQEAAPTEAMKVEVRKVMSAVFKEAVYDGLMAYNPVLSVRPPEPPEYEPEILDLEDIEVYLWHFKDTKIESAVLLVLGGSYRRGELVAMDVADINLETGDVAVDNEFVNSKQGVIEDTPKNHKKRRNRLPKSIIRRLSEILPESGPVMQNDDGSRMKPSSVSQLYERTRDNLPEGVPRITLKNFRHTSLTVAFDATGNMEQVANHGGHSKAVSKKHYVRPHEQQEQQLAEEMDGLLGDVLNARYRAN